MGSVGIPSFLMVDGQKLNGSMGKSRAGSEQLYQRERYLVVVFVRSTVVLFPFDGNIKMNV